VEQGGQNGQVEQVEQMELVELVEAVKQAPADSTTVSLPYQPMGPVSLLHQFGHQVSNLKELCGNSGIMSCD
jgi:hypothetical protein